MTYNTTADSLNLTAEEELFMSISTPSPLLTRIHNYCLLFIILAVMLAMGADMQPFQIRDYLRRPVGVLTGMLCQFGFMPLSGFAMVKILGVEGLYATGIMLVSCCPGGSISNILTFMAGGEIALSVTMTAMSTAIALGMMPLNMWIYGHALDTQNIVIPYANIALSLVYVTSPVVLGMIIKWKLPKVAPYITKIGGFLGFIVITALCLLEIVLFYEMYLIAPWSLYVSAFLLLPLGFCMGYLVALLLRQTPSIRKTVGIESGVQNAALAITIAYMSFEVPGQLIVRLYPVLYGISQAIIGFLVCAIYRVVLYARNKANIQEISTVDKATVCRYSVVDSTLTEKLLIEDHPLNSHCMLQINPVNHGVKIRQK